MRVIVIGAGKLGFEVAKRLADEDHDIVVVDIRESALSEVADHLDVLTVQGNGASPAVLREARVGKAGLLIAVTSSDEVNMIACMTAKQSGVPTCAARIRNPDYTGEGPFVLSQRMLGIDMVINPERIAAMEILRLIKTPAATHVEYFAGGQVTMLRLKVDADAPITRGPLADVNPKRCVVAAVVRNGEVIVPNGETTIQTDDRVYLVGRTGNFSEIRSLVGSPAKAINHVVIAGGGKVGYPLAELLSPAVKRGMHIKLIDQDPEHCKVLAAKLPDVLVICGDAEKIDVLKEELVGDADAFVAVTSHDHTNILSTMIAKQLKVREAIATVSREDYVPLAEKAGADAVVVPRLITASTVLRLVRERNVLSVALLEEGNAEVMELEVGQNARAVGRTLRAMNGLKGAIVGAIVRNDEFIKPRGDTVIEAGDRVVIFALPGSVPKVEDLFHSE